MLGNKYKQYLNDIKSSVKDNPKKFLRFVKANTKSSSHPQLLKYGRAFSSCSMERSNMFNDFFHSVFTQDCPIVSERDLQSHSVSLLGEIVLTVDEVQTCLLELDPTKAVGPDKIPGRFLKSTANEIAPSVCRLFNLSLKLGVMPVAWKEANTTPVYKNNNPICDENYRPISLLCTLSKVLEKCIYN